MVRYTTVLVVDEYSYRLLMFASLHVEQSSSVINSMQAFAIKNNEGKIDLQYRNPSSLQ